MDDVRSLCIYANNSKVSENLRDIFPFPYAYKDAEFFIKNIASATKNLILAIEVDGVAAGSIGILPQADVYRKNAELGYWLGEPFWGRGIATEAVTAMVTYSFQHFDLHRIFASVFERNLASIRVLEKCGFVREAIHYKAVVKKALLWMNICMLN
jgi:RimJ/RimL family protein N-acetyltransferase